MLLVVLIAIAAGCGVTAGLVVSLIYRWRVDTWIRHDTKRFNDRMRGGGK